MIGAEFVCVLDCGHRRFRKRRYQSGLAYCATCQAYVGVVVLSTESVITGRGDPPDDLIYRGAA